MSIQAMKQALEALDNWCDLERSYNERNLIRDSRGAITALRAAIEAAERQEPAFWVHEDSLNPERETIYKCHMKPFTDWIPLYTTPQPAIPAGCALVKKSDAHFAAQYMMGAIANGADVEVVGKRLLAAAPKPENSHD